MPNYYWGYRGNNPTAHREENLQTMKRHVQRVMEDLLEESGRVPVIVTGTGSKAYDIELTVKLRAK